MTIHDLLLKLEEARSFLDGSKDEMANDAHDTINGLIYDVETGRLEEQDLSELEPDNEDLLL